MVQPQVFHFLDGLAAWWDLRKDASMLVVEQISTDF